MAGAAALLVGFSLISSESWAACTPAASAGAPPSGTTVTCSGTTLNQNAPAGYGDGTQEGITINVQNGASVAGTGAGIAVSGQVTANTINNSGTIKDDGSNPTSFSGITATGTVKLTNNASGTISGSSTGNGAIIGVNVGVLQGSNAGSITVGGERPSFARPMITEGPSFPWPAAGLIESARPPIGQR